ncbi:MAG TPA: ribosome maturation factor RimM [Syntrophales bacterium]|nr:ribosome maturation factor RimM [Syntrophales bacterium]
MDFLEIGKIVKPHGLKGSVKVLSYLESGDLLESLDRFSIRQRNDETVSYSLKSLRVKGRYIYLEMEGIETVEQAYALNGCPVLIPTDKLKALPEGEYYWQELIGLEVITEEGRPVGKLERIFSAGDSDVYVCTGGEREILLPAIEEVVRKIDPEKGVMVVRLLEGI